MNLLSIFFFDVEVRRQVIDHIRVGGGHHERCANLAGHLLQVERDDLGGRAVSTYS